MSKLTKLQKSQVIYDDLVDAISKFGVDITTAGISVALKGTINSSLEKIENQENEATNQ